MQPSTLNKKSLLIKPEYFTLIKLIEKTFRTSEDFQWSRNQNSKRFARFFFCKIGSAWEKQSLLHTGHWMRDTSIWNVII